VSASAATAPSYRRATAADAAQVARLSQQLGYAIAGPHVSGYLARVDDRAEIVILACDGDAAVGWAHVKRQELLIAEPYAELEGLVVDAGHRRRGIGQELVRRAEAWASERGLATLRLRSNVARVESHPFYLGLGYERTKTSHAYSKTLR
jgi:GNAT superfamily N-acetyltransferase